MTAASGAPAPPRAIRGLAPLAHEPPGLWLTDRLALTIADRIATLPERTRAEIWTAVSGWARVAKAVRNWDALTAAEAGRQRRRVERAAEAVAAEQAAEAVEQAVEQAEAAEDVPTVNVTEPEPEAPPRRIVARPEVAEQAPPERDAEAEQAALEYKIRRALHG